MAYLHRHTEMMQLLVVLYLDDENVLDNVINRYRLKYGIYCIYLYLSVCLSSSVNHTFSRKATNVVMYPNCSGLACSKNFANTLKYIGTFYFLNINL